MSKQSSVTKDCIYMKDQCNGGNYCDKAWGNGWGMKRGLL